MSHADAVRSYWEAAERRDWETFASLLCEDVAYRLPQTGETITGKRRYLRFNIELPGDWHITVHRVLAGEDEAASWVRAKVGDDQQDALTFFRFDAAGEISEITDFWPERYVAPARPDGVVDER